MNLFKGARNLSIFWRKAILFTVLFVLAAPMAVLIGKGLAGRVAGFDSKPLFEQFEMDQELGESLLEIQETGEELRQHMDNIPDMATTSTFTGDMATTSQE